MPENCALSGVLQTCHLLDSLHGEGQGAAHSHTGHQAGVVVGKEAAGHIAGNVQTLHGLIVGVQSLTLFVDGDALLGGQQGSTQPAAVEGRGANGAQAVSGLAEVLIVLLIVQLVVALHGSKEGVLGSTGKAHLVGQLVQRIALEQCTGLDSLVHLALNVLLTAVAGLGRAADGVEALCILQNVSIADLCVDAARLVGGSVDDIVIGAALVGKTLAVAVYLQEGLSTGVVLADLTGESLTAKGALAVHITGIHPGATMPRSNSMGADSLSRLAPAHTAARMP